MINYTENLRWNDLKFKNPINNIDCDEYYFNLELIKHNITHENGVNYYAINSDYYSQLIFMTKCDFNFKKICKDNININLDNISVIVNGILFCHNSKNLQLNNLPVSIFIIKFLNPFNQPLNFLPNSVILIEFGDNFNQKIDNLPNSIVVLKFGKCFAQSIENLPKSIKVITFYVDYLNYYSTNLNIVKLYNNLKYINSDKTCENHFLHQSMYDSIYTEKSKLFVNNLPKSLNYVSIYNCPSDFKLNNYKLHYCKSSYIYVTTFINTHCENNINKIDN